MSDAFQDDPGGMPPRPSTPRPRPSAPRAPDHKPIAGPSPADRKLTEALAGTYVMLGSTLGTLGMLRGDAGVAGTGQAIVEQSGEIAEAWVDLGNRNPKVKVALKRFTEVSSAGTLIALHVSVALPLLNDRGVFASGRD